MHALESAVVYASPLLRRLLHRPDPVIESPIDVDKITPRRGARRRSPLTGRRAVMTSRTRSTGFCSTAATDLIAQLRADRALRERIGQAARRTVEDLYRGSAWRSKLSFFIQQRRAASFGPMLDPTPSQQP